jgi:hypothetical protein
MAAALAEGGRKEEAARATGKARELVPRLSLAIYRRPRAEGTLWQKFIDGLRKAPKNRRRRAHPRRCSCTRINLSRLLRCTLRFRNGSFAPDASSASIAYVRKPGRGQR